MRGAAGMPAALESMEQGVKSVILLDKFPYPGGNARMAGGYFFAADAYTQAEAGTVFHKEDAYKEAMRYSHGQNINPRVLRAFIDRSADNLDLLRAKGIVAADEGEWFHFDYTPGEIDIRRGPAGVTGRLCVIGAQLKEAAVAELFR